jgi:hypothetical protein
MRTVIALGLMLTLMSAGCARSGDKDDGGVATARSGGPTATAAASATPSEDPDAQIKYSRCMREQGMTWFPDPDNDGNMSVRIPPGLDEKKFDAAQKACQKFSPDGGRPHQANPEDIERGRQLAKCMRENGVPDFPDPKADGSIQLDRDKIKSKPGDPSFDKAEEICSKYMPKGAQHREKKA